MKIQSLLSKLGWIVTGWELFFIIQNFFVRYEMKEEVISTVSDPEGIKYYENLFKLVVANYTLSWTIILFTGVLIAVMLYKWLHLRYGICACIAIIMCRILYACSMEIFKSYEEVYTVTTVYPAALITIMCCIISAIPLIGVLIYKKMAD